MNIENNNKCDICLTVSSSLLVLSCNHKFCFKCFPLSILHLLSTKGIDSSFLTSELLSISCLLCSNGTIQIPVSQNLIDSLNIKQDKNGKKCDCCDSNTNLSYCTICEIYMCELCIEKIHNLMYRNKPKHEILKINPKISIIKCDCKNILKIDSFCLDCEVTICEICSVLSHLGHKKTKLDELFSEYLKPMNLDVFKDFNEKFEEFYESINMEISNIIEKNQKLFSETLDRIIKALQEMKNKLNSNKYNNSQKYREKLDIIKWSLFNVNFNVNNISEVPICYRYRLQKLLQFKDFIFKKFELIPNQFKSVYEILNALNSEIRSDLTKVMDIREGSIKFINEIKNNSDEFINDPRYTLNKLTHVIEKVDFDDFKWKRDKITIFNKENETYICWGRRCDWGIEIHNLTRKTTEYILTGHTKYINMISSFENYLYSCANDFRIWNINKNFSLFLHIPNLSNSNSTYISSAKMFRDVFNEINLGQDLELFIFSFNDIKSSIYCHDLTGKQIKIFEVNSEKKSCTYLTIYHSYKHLQTYILSAYKESYLKIIDIKSNNILSQISINDCISAIYMDIEINNNEIIYFIEGGYIKSYNLSKSCFIEQQKYGNIIWDMEVWSKEYILIGTKEHFKVIDRKSLKLIADSEKFKDNEILNIRKFKYYNGKEGLAFVNYENNQLKIYSFD